MPTKARKTNDSGSLICEDLLTLGRSIQVAHRVKAVTALHNAISAVHNAEITPKEGLSFLLTDAEVLDAVLVLWATGDTKHPPIEIYVDQLLTDEDWYRLLVAAAGKALTDTTTSILIDWS